MVKSLRIRANQSRAKSSMETRCVHRYYRMTEGRLVCDTCGQPPGTAPIEDKQQAPVENKGHIADPPQKRLSGWPKGRSRKAR